MITLDVVKIEAYDSETKGLVFTATTFDAHSCTIEINSLLSNGNVEEVTDAVKTAVKMLRLT